MGKKKRPFYRLVVLDSRKRRDGAYLANLGYYNPFVEPFEINLHEDKIIAWLQKGATISETARSLLRSQGVLFKYSLVRQGLSEEEILRVYNAGEMVRFRLKRLLDTGQVVSRGNRYYIGKPIVLFIARVLVAIKWVFLSQRTVDF